MLLKWFYRAIFLYIKKIFLPHMLWDIFFPRFCAFCSEGIEFFGFFWTDVDFVAFCVSKPL